MTLVFSPSGEAKQSNKFSIIKYTKNNKCDLNHRDHSNDFFFFTYSYISRPFSTSHSPNNPSFISFNTRSVWNAAAGSTVYRAGKKIPVAHSRSSQRAQIFIGSWKMLLKIETIKTAAYLPKVSGRRKRHNAAADILHISKHDLLRCESHPKKDETRWWNVVDMARKAIKFSCFGHSAGILRGPSITDFDLF